MAIKKQIFLIKGMQRDLSKSKFNPEYAYTIYNMRVMPTDTSTLFSLINEQGTREVTVVDSSNNPLTIQGTSLGQCVINDRLVIFTTKPNATYPDYIYKLVLKVPVTGIPYFEGEILYNGNLGFNIENPIECLTSYETEDILKVYWVDGVNCPRVINIEATTAQKAHWKDTFFNFLPSLRLSENGISIVRNDSGGEFPGGTLLYCITYSNLNGQESKIAWISNLIYITNLDRAVAPDEICNCSYAITINSTIDNSFDFVNLYSIIRTSYNGTPIVKLLTKFDTTGVTSLNYVDTNLYGTSVDPVELLYKGGEYFKAKTLEAKDNTLFMGNIEVPYNNPGTLPTSSPYPYSIDVVFVPSNLKYWKQNTLNSYLNELINSGDKPITYLKDSNIYRLGLQLLDERGNWSDPIFIKDYKVKGFPKIDYTNEGVDNINNVNIVIPQVQITFNSVQVHSWIEKGFKRARPVIVLPTKQERVIIALGIVSPTVFTPANRLLNNPYVLPSWFFRPYPAGRGYAIGATFDEHASVEGRHNHVLRPATAYNGECSFIESATYDTSAVNAKQYATLSQDESVSLFENDNRFFVDSSIYTFNSPDLDDLTEEDLTGAHARIIGLFFIDSSYADVHIEATPGNITKNLQDVRTSCLANCVATSNSTTPFGFSNSTPWLDKINPAGGGWADRYCAVFPWQRTGSLNDGPQSGTDNAVLLHKILTNMRHSQTFVYIRPNYGRPIWYSEDPEITHTAGIGKVKLCKEENESLYGLDLQTARENYTNSLNGEAFLNYKNHIDQYITHVNKASIPFSETKGGTLGCNSFADHRDYEETTTRIKYFTKTHAVITLNDDPDFNTQYTLPIPRHGGSYPSEYTPGYDGEYPFWFDYGMGGNIYYPEFLIDSLFNSVYGNYGFYNFLCNPNNPHNPGSADTNPITNFKKKEVMWIVELYRDTPANIFGGNTEQALQLNNWIPADVSLKLVDGLTLTLKYREGDTVFNRWDCFKTLPYSEDDINSVVEMMSFMCESYKNTAGRYDKLRGLADYSFVNRGTEINVYNDAYNNKDNFFSYTIRPENERKTKEYPNYIVWSLVKSANSEIDTWTQMTLASVLELDGNKGVVTSLNRLNNNLLCFQEQGISLILYNESIQIQSTTGVPIEIANSGKVLGKRYIDNIVGCSNKWSIAVGAKGIYFIDDITKGIYLLGSEGLKEISDDLGFHSFINSYSVTTKPWNSKNDNKNCITYYDKINGDVFFIWNNGICLCYSEALGQFMSFFPYKGPGFANISDSSFWIAFSNNPDELDEPIKIWEHNAGDYNTFYNYCEPYGVTIIANLNPTTDKIFDNIEFRSDSWVFDEYNQEVLDQSTFDTLITETEYQRGISALVTKGYRLGDRLYKNVVVLPWSTLQWMTVLDPTAREGKTLYQAEKDDGDPTHSLHYYTFRPEVSENLVDVTSEITSVSVNNPSNLKRKFRIWRALIPRNNAGTAVSQPSRDRMRNPWLTIHLYKYGTPVVGELAWPHFPEEIPVITPASISYEVEHKEKTVLHDIVVSYTE